MVFRSRRRRVLAARRLSAPWIRRTSPHARRRWSRTRSAWHLPSHVSVPSCKVLHVQFSPPHHLPPPHPTKPLWITTVCGYGCGGRAGHLAGSNASATVAMAMRALASRLRPHGWGSRCMSTVDKVKDTWWSEDNFPNAAVLREEIERRFQQDLPPGASCECRRARHENETKAIDRRRWN